MALARSPLRIALAVVVAVGIVAGGGYLLLADETPRPTAATVDNASERVASLDGFSATVVSTVRQDDETTRIVRNVTARPGTGKYRSVSVDGNSSGVDVTVSNGSVTWLYDSENETVRRLRLDGARNGTGVLPSGRYVERLLRAAVDDSNETAAGVSALPMVSSPGARSPSGTLPANRSALNLTVSYEGVERTSGRDAYVVEMRPSGDDGRLSNYSARAWVDAERFVVLRQRTNFTFDGTRYVSATRYRNVSFDPDLGNVSFTFDPPPGANVTVVSSPSMTRYDSRAALADDASLAVPDPEVPAGFRFERGMRTVGERRSLTLQYTNGTASLSVSVRNATLSGGSDDGAAVQIGSQTGYLQTMGATRLVNWECGGRSHTVIASNAGNETVIDVAESIDCE